MFNPSNIPSLSSYLDTLLTCEVVPGKAAPEGLLYVTFSIPSTEVGKMTASEMFTFYLKPAVDGLAEKINKCEKVCTMALSLPSGTSKVIGICCWKGRIPVNIYIARRKNPDRHQFIISLMAKKVE